MATLGEVLEAIERIERAGLGGNLTTAAKTDISVPLLAPRDYDRILDRLRAAFPQVFSPPGRSPSPPQSPAPGEAPEQQGVAVQVMKKAETALSHQQSAAAEFDRQVIEALLHAHKTTGEGRRQLDDLEAQVDSAARRWDLSTAAGAREFQRFLVGKLRQIVAVVQDTNDDDTSKQALAAAWAALYATQLGTDGSAATDRADAPTGSAASPPDFPDTGMDSYLDAGLGDEFEPRAEGTPQPGGSAAAPAPAVPAFGGGMPGAGAMPTGGLPGELAPLAGLLRGPQRTSAPEYPDDGPPLPDEMYADGPSSEEGDQKEADDDAAAPDSAPTTGPTNLTLPNGETVTAPTPRLAAVIQAAADGTPVADAFRQQGMTIPPPGTAVASPVDQSRVDAGDVGMFTDRHALAVGNSKALLDGQIQHIANIAGPSFLGWQHPPMSGETATPTRTPTPTLPSATLRA